MLLRKTLGGPKEDEAFLKKRMLLLSVQLLPPHWFMELLHVDLWSTFPYYVYGRLNLVYHHRFHFIALPTFTTDFISHISFNYTSHFYHKFHFQGSCCLHHKFHLRATSIADFILTSRVKLMADFILLMNQVSCHSTRYFHHKFHIIDFITLHTLTTDIISAHFIIAADFITFHSVATSIADFILFAT